MKTRLAAACLVTLFALAPEASAKLKGEDQAEIKAMLYPTLYLRTAVPTTNAVAALIEISPTGYSWERLVGAAEKKAKGKPSGVYFPFRPNDTVKWGKPSYNKDQITVWFEGERDELKVIFIQINTLDDFKKAFRQLFSTVPLQDENPDWQAEVKTAVADRRLIEGMTRRQASCVAGTPLKIETSKEGASEVEIWHLRQETGDRRAGKMTSTGLPARIRFVNDKLTAIER